MINLDLLSDRELTLLLKQDDCSAFSKIYERYWQDLYNTAYKRSRNRELCQDIVQNVFTDLWNRRETLTIEDLPAFLHTAIRFQVFKQVTRQPEQASFLDLFEEIIMSPAHADDMILEKEIVALMQTWIEALPAKRRKIFLLHYTEDLSTKEIAEHLGVSQKTVQNQLNTASQSLRTRLAHFLSLSVVVAFMLK